MPGSTTTFAELQANVAKYTPTWSAVKATETVPWGGGPPYPPGVSPTGWFTRAVVRVLNNKGAVVVSGYTAQEVNQQYLSLQETSG